MQSSGGGGGGGGSWGDYYRQVTGYGDPGAGGQQPGGRRQKIAGFLKSANELRQSYYAGYAQRSTDMEKELDDFSGGQPQDSWPDVEVMRSGDEELVLFPSYARRRAAGRRRQTEAEAGGDDWLKDERPAADAGGGNIVDVDVRGWLFAPHSGPLTRKNRYLHWVALKLCGLPAQTLSQPGEPDRDPTAAEAEATGKTAAEIANPSPGPRPPSLYSLDDAAAAAAAPRYSNPAAAAVARRLSWRPAPASAASTQSLPGPAPPPPPALSSAEIASAHAALTARLAPFMHRPIPAAPVTVFFFNAASSQSRTLTTSESGHFALRVALPFTPTHVRVLASETLSATEPVSVHSPAGISLISDIDDTVKHSAVSLGAREIFRNTFTAPLASLHVPGVADWYSRLAAPPYNLSFHYVSNSPWQLYPVLKSFFQEAGLPPGSMHLKQYSGMLQGIFEPVAERKKGTVERVIRDFPERRWILVGDSGEADLEVYTEIVEKFPGRVLAVFIRDVTTAPVAAAAEEEKGFFDSNENRAEYDRTMQEWADEKAASIREAKVPPPVPPKRRSGARTTDEDGPTRPDAPPRSTSTSSRKTPPPPKPAKPPSLQGLSRTNTLPTSSSSAPPSPPPPPLPRRTATISGTSPEDRLPPRPQTSSAGPVLGAYPPPPQPASAGPVPGAYPPPPQSPAPSLQQQEVMLSKREELWMRRWERALGIMARHGVVLQAWRTGADVEVVCRGVVEEALWGK